MEELTSCKTAIENCKLTRTFSIAHLYKEEKAMDMHIHDCYELYYSISGGKQFLTNKSIDLSNIRSVEGNFSLILLWQNQLISPLWKKSEVIFVYSH